MNPKIKKIGKILLVVFLIWVFITIALAFGGTYAYDVEKIRYDPDIPSTIPPSNIHITDQDLVTRPYLKDAFGEGKSILLPRGDLTDLIPGNAFGPEYAMHRMPVWEKEAFVHTIVHEHNTVWEHNGTYIRFLVRTG
ncbi:MAG TPA: hypothetical protein HA264_06365 [Methanolinea sp.]|jgi:hypothetical protein|nr:MAG: hypothetical protein A4E36_00195 [Methanoregulaceae archaeon PtaB.Bin009]OPY37732.1 MAG: hypothetical protein A4E41_02170 [Methanoregulaceae archaeon PtaU1.Bin066]HII76645.1 hypothetical protein [Methanolinea sp.]